MSRVPPLPAGAGEVDFGEHTFGSPSADASFGGSYFGKVLDCVDKVADDEFQYIFLAMERLHRVIYHFCVVFDDDDRSPEAYHIEVGAGPHQACFCDSRTFGLLAHAAAAFGLYIADDGVSHGDDRIEPGPGIGKVFT